MHIRIEAPPGGGVFAPWLPKNNALIYPNPCNYFLSSLKGLHVNFARDSMCHHHNP